MSNHWGYACLDHDPAIVMDDMGGNGGRPNHARDAMFDAFVRHRRGEWPYVEHYPGAGYDVPEPLVGATGCQSAAPLHFLDHHPRCRIAIFDEYGETWVPQTGGLLQVSGYDERDRTFPVRDPVTNRVTGHEPGVYPPPGDERCTCVVPTLAVTHSALIPRGGPHWVRCTACGGTSVPGERG